MSFLIKICGLSTTGTMSATLDAGADMVGLVFHPKSPRAVSVDQAAALARLAKGRAETVALIVDADDALLSQIILEVRPDRVQLHGKETPDRVRDIEQRFCIPVMKAIGLANVDDIAEVRRYHTWERQFEAKRMILLDAKPPTDAAYPGGHGKTFDWEILRSFPDDLAFMLSGGLTPENVAEAIKVVRDCDLALHGVDVSSGVESAPGVKDIEKIQKFIAATRDAANQDHP